MNKLTVREESRELLKDILEDMITRFDLEELQKAGIIESPSEDLSQDDIENIYSSTDFKDVLTAYLDEIVEFTKYEFTDYELNELYFYANKELQGE